MNERHNLFCLRQIFILFVFIIPISLCAQNIRTITGKVLDSGKEPLPGVTIVVPNAGIGTVSSVNGSFEIKVPSNTVSLSFSYIGMETKNVGVKDKNTVTVVMEEASHVLDEVVAIGYGTIRKSDLTGAVSSLDSKITQGRIVNSLEDALQGRVAGVHITSNDGTPGGGVDIKIRGINSISASSTPLYVIDGIPYDLSDDQTGIFDFWEFGTSNNNPIGGISPGDIESIEILKDASATAIYGARGVNGVILVTTKRGRKGKAKVEFNGNFGTAHVTRKIDVLNGPEYAKFLFDANGGYTAANNPYLNWQSYESPDSTNTDWQDEIFRTAYTHDYRLNISGGSDNVQYAIIGNYFNQEGVIINSGYERYTGRVNLSAELARNLTLSANLYSGYSKSDGVTTGFNYGVISQALRVSPLRSVESMFLDMEDGDVVYNPVADALYSVRDKTEKQYQASFNLAWKVIPDITLNLKGSYVDKNTLYEGFAPNDNARVSKTNGVASIAQTGLSKLLGEATATYYKRIKKMYRLSVMVGSTIEKYDSKKLSVTTRNFYLDDLGVNKISMGNSLVTPTNEYVPTSMASFFGRANYNFKERYMITATIRADGSSKFPEGNKFACFPSVALAWRMNEEAFIKPVDWVGNIKWRLSYGSAGNQALPAYQSLGMLQTVKTTVDGQTSTDAVYPSRIANKKLKWETTDQFNVGLDLGFLNNKIDLTVDAYYKKTRDLLLQVNTPRYTGFSNYWSNLGGVENKGLEITLKTVNFSKTAFKWNSAFNIAFNRSKVTDLGPDTRMELTGDKFNVTGTIGVVEVGQPIGNFYGYVVEGVWQTQEEINSSPIETQLGTAKANLKPGYRKYKDKNGDNVIDDADKEIIGHGEPVFIGGFLNNFSYKNFDLSVNLQFSYGGDIFNINRIYLENGDKSNNQSGRVRDRFRPSFGQEGDAVYDPGQISYTIKRADTDVQTVPNSDYVEDGSFLRISDVTLGYNFQHLFRLTKAANSVLCAYVSAKNLCIISKYLGYDPEVTTGQGGISSLLPGLDLDAYPKATTFSIGCSITF